MNLDKYLGEQQCSKTPPLLSVCDEYGCSDFIGFSHF